MLLRQTTDQDRIRSLGLQAVQARTHKLRVLPNLNHVSVPSVRIFNSFQWRSCP
jgi:hypothetical protein